MYNLLFPCSGNLNKIQYFDESMTKARDLCWSFSAILARSAQNCGLQLATNCTVEYSPTLAVNFNEFGTKKIALFLRGVTKVYCQRHYVKILLG